MGSWNPAGRVAGASASSFGLVSPEITVNMLARPGVWAIQEHGRRPSNLPVILERGIQAPQSVLLLRRECFFSFQGPPHSGDGVLGSLSASGLIPTWPDSRPHGPLSPSLFGRRTRNDGLAEYAAFLVGTGGAGPITITAITVRIITRRARRTTLFANRDAFCKSGT